MWKTACLILFFVSAALVVPSALLAIGFNGGIPTQMGFWMFLAIPLAPLYGWWRIKCSEVAPEDMERSRRNLCFPPMTVIESAARRASPEAPDPRH